MVVCITLSITFLTSHKKPKVALTSWRRHHQKRQRIWKRKRTKSDSKSHGPRPRLWVFHRVLTFLKKSLFVYHKDSALATEITWPNNPKINKRAFSLFIHRKRLYTKRSNFRQRPHFLILWKLCKSFVMVLSLSVFLAHSAREACLWVMNILNPGHNGEKSNTRIK